MRSGLFLSLVTLLGCSSVGELDEEEVLRGPGRLDIELPATPRPDHAGPPPEIAVEAYCDDDACSSILLTAVESKDVDTYEWWVDGVRLSTESYVVVALEKYPLMVSSGGDADDEKPGLSNYVDFELYAAGNGKEIRYSGAMLQSPLLRAGQGEPSDVDDDEIQPIIVVGAVGCQDPIVITQFGGCLVDNSDITHEVILTGPGGQSQDFLTYDAGTNSVYLGHADGAVWKLNGMTVDAFGGQVNAGNYGTGPGNQYPPLAPAGENHLTSYYSLIPGQSLTLQANHYYGTDNQLTVPATLTLNCTNDGIVAGAFE